MTHKETDGGQKKKNIVRNMKSQQKATTAGTQKTHELESTYVRGKTQVVKRQGNIGATKDWNVVRCTCTDGGRFELEEDEAKHGAIIEGSAILSRSCVHVWC